jgi:hypothetical protein
MEYHAGHKTSPLSQAGLQPTFACPSRRTRPTWHPMRCCVYLLLAIALLSTAPAADLEIVRVWPSWRDAESFERIGEYFGRPENTGRETVLRTQPAARDGYYFLVRVKAVAASPGTRFALSVIRPDTPEPKTYLFPVERWDKENIFQLGLTGADWPQGKKANPVAWKIALQDHTGAVLAEHKSFLWEKPAK